MRVAAIGRTEMLYDSIRAVSAAGHKVAVIVTAAASAEAVRVEADFAELAEKLGARFFVSNRLTTAEIAAACEGCDAAFGVNWPFILEKDSIEIFSLGILNCHAGDLPRYRGNACPNWALLQGESSISMCVHLVEAGKLDCGRVIAEESFAPISSTRFFDVVTWINKTAPRLFVQALAKLGADSSFTLRYADEHSPPSFRCYPRLPADGFIDWADSIQAVDRLIRASGPPLQGAYTYALVKDRVRKLHILEAAIISSSSNDLAAHGHVLKNDVVSGMSLVRCGCGTLGLILCRYADEGESFMPGRRWKSIRFRLGLRPEDWLWHLEEGRLRLKPSVD